MSNFKGDHKKSLLIVFVKNLIVGNVKSRLALTIGYNNALEIYKNLLNKTHQVAIEIPFDKQVAYSSSMEKNDIWEATFFNKTIQHGEDIGERMYNAFCKAFADGYENVILIGSDIINLRSEIVIDAFDQLQQSDLVIGPAVDGGYYLIGLKRPMKQLFENKEWSTNKVFIQTLKSSLEMDLKISLEPELADFDRIEDYKFLHAEDWDKYKQIIKKDVSNLTHPYLFRLIKKGA